jgi:hypothetical protein
LVGPTATPRASDFLNGIVRLPSQASRGGEVNLPPAIIPLPALPVVNSECFAAQGIQEALSITILTITLKGEGQAFQTTIVPGAIASPVLIRTGFNLCDS